MKTDHFQDSNQTIIKKLIEKFILNHQIFTLESVYLALTDIVNRDPIIDDVLGTDGYHEFKKIVKLTLKVSKSSVLNLSELTQINNLLQNISLRQFFYVNNGTISHISLNTLIKIFDLIELTEKEVIKEFYKKLDPNKLIDVVNDVFRPLETNIKSQLPMCVIVPSFNNENTLNKTFESIYTQNYHNYRLIFVDDRSDDNSLNLVKKLSNQYNKNNQSLIFRQYVRQRQGAGRFIGYHCAFDDEIIVLLDGDDYFYDSQTLETVNSAYQNSAVATSYGSYIDLYGSKLIQTRIKGSEKFSDHVIKNKLYRYHRFISTHLRTAYAYLFKNIKLRDLLYSDNKFYKIMTDFAESIPLLEMATSDINPSSESIKVITKPIYVYNFDNSVKFNTSYAKRNDKGNEFYHDYRKQSAQLIRDLPKYSYSLKNGFENDQQNPDEMFNHVLSLMDYGVDFLVIDTGKIIDKLSVLSDPIYLSAELMNTNLNHKIFNKQIKQLKLVGFSIDNNDIEKIITEIEKTNIVIKRDTQINKEKYYIIGCLNVT